MSLQRRGGLERAPRLESAATNVQLQTVRVDGTGYFTNVDTSNEDGKELIKQAELRVPNAGQVSEKLLEYAPLDQPTFESSIAIEGGGVSYRLRVHEGKLQILKGDRIVCEFDELPT